MRFYLSTETAVCPIYFLILLSLFLKDLSFKFYLILQKALCDKMLGFTRSETNKYHIRRDYTTNTPQVNCYMYNLDSFLDVSTTSSLLRSSIRKSKMIAIISLYVN